MLYNISIYRKEIRKRYSNDMTAIILTAYNRDEIMEDAIRTGFDSFLSKPVEPEQLFKTLEELIGENDNRNSSGSADE